MNNKTKNIVLSALFAACTAILSQISIPLPFTPVPINLATLGVCIAGAMLGFKWGAFSQVVYVLLGAIGIPVFANFTSGIGIIAGPTGGYIAGYIAAAAITGLVVERYKRNMGTYMVAMSLGIIGCYVLGTAWFIFVTKSGLVQSLLLCVVPFLIGDLIKIVAAAALGLKLKKHI